MTPDSYALQSSLITSRVARTIQIFARLYAANNLSWTEWLQLLQLLYPEVEAGRADVARLARQFYDEQRREHHPELPRNDRPVEHYEFGWFAENMEPARREMSRMASSENAVAQLILQAVREVENAGRRQIIHAVQNDRQTQIVQGWARVATGRETCAWCLMLVSRGPVYSSAKASGLDLSDDEAKRMVAAGLDVKPYMNDWHTGCDCKVVPVFDVDNWIGKDAADRALELWNDATLEAIAEEDDGRVHLHGKHKGEEFTRNQLAINALRRRLESGEIDPYEFAALAA